MVVFMFMKFASLSFLYSILISKGFSVIMYLVPSQKTKLVPIIDSRIEFISIKIFLVVLFILYLYTSLSE